MNSDAFNRTGLEMPADRLNRSSRHITFHGAMMSKSAMKQFLKADWRKTIIFFAFPGMLFSSLLFHVPYTVGRAAYLLTMLPFDIFNRMFDFSNNVGLAMSLAKNGTSSGYLLSVHPFMYSHISN